MSGHPEILPRGGFAIKNPRLSSADVPHFREATNVSHWSLFQQSFIHERFAQISDFVDTFGFPVQLKICEEHIFAALQGFEAKTGDVDVKEMQAECVTIVGVTKFVKTIILYKYTFRFRFEAGVFAHHLDICWLNLQDKQKAWENKTFVDVLDTQEMRKGQTEFGRYASDGSMVW